MTTHDSAPAAGSRHAAVRVRDDAVVARLRQLSTALDGEPDPQFRAATRARLVAMAAVRSPAPAPRPWFRRVFDRAEDAAPSAWRARLTGGLAGAAVAVTAVAALLAVSSGANPGDALYGLKRGTEQTKLALASDSTRGRTLLDFAGTRLHELQVLARSGNSAAPVGGVPAGQTPTVLAAGPSPSLVLDTIATMDRQTTEGAYWVTTQAVRTHDAGALEDLSRWVQGQSSGLRALGPDLPAAAGPSVQRSLGLLGDVGTRAGALTTSLSCPTGPATSGSDPLGPVPGTCAPAPAGGATGGNAGTTALPGQPSGGSTAPAPNGSAAPSLPAAPSAAPGGGATTTLPGGGLPGVTLPGVTSPVTPPALPLPTVTVPLPGLGGGTPAAPSTSTPPPLIDTNLPVCLPGVLC